MQFLLDDASVFEHQPKQIYQLDTDTVKPVRSQYALVGYESTSTKLVAKVSLSNICINLSNY